LPVGNVDFEFSAICFFHTDCTARGESCGDRESAGRATTAGDAASLLGIPILPFSLGGHCGVDILKDHHESVECVASIELGARGGLCISKAIFSAI